MPTSRKRLWIALGVSAVLLLCLGTAGIIGAIYWLKNSSVTSTGASPSPSPSAAPSLTRPTMHIVLPIDLGSRKRNDSVEARGLTSQVKGVFAAFEAPFADAYGTLANKDLVIFAASTIGPSTRANLDNIMYKVRVTRSSPITNYTDVLPAPYDGTARCADMRIDNVDAALCGWADMYSAGVVLFYYSNVQKASQEFTAIREQIERPR